MCQLRAHVTAGEAAASEDRSAWQRAVSREQDQDLIVGQLQSHLAEYRRRLEQSEAEREAITADLGAQWALQLQRETEAQLEASKAADYVRAIKAQSSIEIDRSREEAKLAKRRIAELERRSTRAATTADGRVAAAMQSQRASEAEAIR